MYVALSRIRHIKNMFLIGYYNLAAIKVNTFTEKQYLRLRIESQIKTLPATQNKEDTLTKILLNTQFLRKHLNDVAMDKHLPSNYIIGFNETQLELRKNAKVIKMKLEKHVSINFNFNLQKHRSISIHYSRSMQLVDSEN